MTIKTRVLKIPQFGLAYKKLETKTKFCFYEIVKGSIIVDKTIWTKNKTPRTYRS